MTTPADTDRLVASPVSVRIQLATLLPTKPAPRSRPPDEVSSDPRPRHRTTHLHRCKLEIWSILRQVTDSCSECSVPSDAATCECWAVVVIIICHLQSVPVVTVVHVVPFVFSLGLFLSSSLLSLAFILPFHGTRWSRSDSLTLTQDLSVFP